MQLKIFYKQFKKGRECMKYLANIKRNQIILSIEDIETKELKNTVCVAFFKETNGKY